MPDYVPIDEEALKLEEQLETLSCSGICKSPIFWGYKRVTEGQPANPCIYTLKAEFDESAGIMGYFMVFTAVMILFVFLFHFGLYLSDEEAQKRKVSRKKFIFD